MPPSKTLGPCRSACVLLFLALFSLAAHARDADAPRLVTLLGLGPGSVVAEVGAGDGSLALALAASVGPGGQVFANELEPRDVAKIAAAAKTAQLDNVTAIRGTPTSSELPDACCDAIVMRAVYHHLTRPREMGESLLRALRPGGRLAVIDFPPAVLLAPWTPEGVPANRGGHGVPAALVADELARIGFEPLRTIEHWRRGWLLQRFYCLLLQKPAAPPTPLP